MLAAMLLPAPLALAADRVTIFGFAIDRTEVTIADFERFTTARKLKTQAETAGGGHEWGGGWQRRPGWTFRTPFGKPPESASEPAVHISWHEAHDYCASVSGRLPTMAEWETAAYRHHATGGGDGGPFEAGRDYPYPTGETPGGANTSADDPWPRHAAAGVTRAGINGLHDMGGNVWEWLADRNGENALTAGGSWWYGPDKMRREAMQWKAADFYVVYIGFRCAYDLPR